MRRLIGRRLRDWLWMVLGLVGLIVSSGSEAATSVDPPSGLETAAVELVLDETGTLTIRGRLPKGFGKGRLRRIFPGLRFDRGLAADSGAAADVERWRRAFAAINIALPRIAHARLMLCDRSLRITGRLRDGFAGRETQAALRAGLGAQWELDFDLAESPPPPRLWLRARDGQLEVDGIVPFGLSPRLALGALGIDETVRVGGALTGGGAGNSAHWSAGLGLVGRLLGAYERAEVELTEGHLAIDGQLAPGQAAQELEAWAGPLLPQGWTVALAGEAGAAEPGARRYDVATGGTARLIQGHWLPELAFEPDRASCDRKMAEAMRRRSLAFPSGSSALSETAGPLLDRLAAIAFTCLKVFGMTLEIGGHTDDRGEPDANRALSEGRARAVRAALEARGVPRAAVRAVGYGAMRPVASNESAKGRERNRRITFRWAGGPG